MINWIARISVVSLAMPVAAMVVLLSVLNGFGDVTRKMTSTFDADVTVLPKEGQVMPLPPVGLTDFGHVTYFLEQQILLEHDGTQTMATLRGVDENYTKVFPIEEAITSGEWQVELGDWDRIVLGRSLARDLGIRTVVDTEVKIYAIRRGSFSTLLPVDGYTTRTLRLKGLFTGDAQNEQKYALTSLRAAQQLFDRPGEVSAAAVKLAPGVSVNDFKKIGDSYQIKTREQMNATFYRLMAFEKWGVFFISLLVLILASFSIVGTLTMLIIDKREDMWTLRALGADTGMIRSIFEREGWLIGALGGGIGLALGMALCAVQQHFGVIPMPVDTLAIQSYPVRLEAMDMALITVTFSAVIGVISRLTVQKISKKG